MRRGFRANSSKEFICPRSLYYLTQITQADYPQMRNAHSEEKVYTEK